MNDLEFKNEYRSYSVQGGMILEFSEIFLTQIFRSGQQVIEVFAGGRVFQTRFEGNVRRCRAFAVAVDIHFQSFTSVMSC